MKNRERVVSAIKVTFRNYKHSDPAVPVDIFLYREKPVCSVSTVLAYLGLRGTSPGPLFCWPDASPISRISLSPISLRYCNLDVEGYKSHSFRIGEASWAAAKGKSYAQIRAFFRVRVLVPGSFLPYAHNGYLYFTLMYPRAQLLSRGQLSVP